MEFESCRAGAIVLCPNCQCETLLFIPRRPIAPGPSNFKWIAILMAVLFVASAGIAFAVRRHQLRLEEADRNWRELMNRKPGREQIEAAEREAAQKEYELKLWLHSVDPENEAAPEPPQSPQLSSNSKK